MKLQDILSEEELQKLKPPFIYYPYATAGGRLIYLEELEEARRYTYVDALSQMPPAIGFRV